MFKGMALPGRGIAWKEFFKRLASEYNRDNIGNVAAALTYFSVQALFPFLLFAVAALSMVMKPADAMQVIQQLGKVAPPQVTQILGDRIQALVSSKSAGLLTFGAAFALVSAASGMTSLMQSLNIVYGVKESRSFIKVRIIAVFLTLCSAVVGLVAAAIAVGGVALANAVHGPLGTVIDIARFPIAGVLMMLLWALLYYFGPDVEQKFKFITPGSIVGVFLWVIASIGFSIYVTKFGNFDATYGTIGAVIVLLMWMWISSQVLLIGAEINAVVEHKSPEGKAAGAKTFGEAGAGNRTKTEVEERGGAVASNPPLTALSDSLELQQRREGCEPDKRTRWQKLRDTALGALLVGGLARARGRSPA